MIFYFINWKTRVIIQKREKAKRNVYYLYHEIVYHKHQKLDNKIMKEEVIEIILNIMKSKCLKMVLRNLMNLDKNGY